MAPFIRLRQIHKGFAGVPVLRNISLEVEEGEILVLLGPSGSGKTTLLRVIAGFETPDEGSIRVGDEDVTSLPPERRNFGMVFQHYALFPHMTVAENIGFGLETRRLAKDELAVRTAEMLALVDLVGFESRRVQEVSGGQQQRVALARALAPHPRLLLLDEPLSNLDPDLRERTRRQLRAAVREVGITAVWVTHEQEEAFDVGDRIALLHAGALEQIGRSEDLYLEPSSLFVAGFVGRASILTGQLLDGERVRIGDERFRGQGVTWRVAGVGALSSGEEVQVVCRPEALRIVSHDEQGALAGKVEERQYTGESTFYSVRLEAGGQLLVRGESSTALVGDRVAVAHREGAPAPRAFRRVPEGSS